jgi:exosome complex component RRP43
MVADSAEAFQKLHPREYYQRFAEQGIRPDGRGLLERRPSTVTVGPISTADGSALATIGRTSVTAGVKLEIIQPRQESAGCGELEINVHLWPACARRFGVGAAPEEAVALSAFLLRTLSCSGTVDLAALCVQPGKAAWIARIDVVCVSHDGNVEDAALLACVAALRSTRVPNVDYDSDTGFVSLAAMQPTPLPRLKINCFPAASTFLLSDSMRLIADPCAQEELLFGDSRVTIVKDLEGRILCATKPGGEPLSDAHRRECLRLAEEHAASAAALVKAADAA